MRVITALLLATLCLAYSSSVPWQRLSGWVKESKSSIFDVSSDLESSPRYQYDSIHTTFAKPGLYTSADTPSNTTVIDIPLDKILTVDSPFLDKPSSADIQFQTLVSMLRAHNVTDAPALLALRLAYERHNIDTHTDAQASPFAPLVSHLASLTTHSPLTWTDPSSEAILPLVEPSSASPLTAMRQHHRSMARGVHGVVAALLLSDTYAGMDLDVADLLKDNATALAGVPEELIQDGKLKVPIHPFADLFATPAPTDTDPAVSGFTAELYDWAYAAALAHGVGLHASLARELAPDSADEAALAIVPGLHVVNHSNPPHCNAELQVVYSGNDDSNAAMTGVRVVTSVAIPSGAQLTVSYGSFMPALRAPAYTTVAAASDFLLHAGSHTLLLAPAPPVPNSLLLLHTGAALPLNAHEPLVLHAGDDVTGDAEPGDDEPIGDNKADVAAAAEAARQRVLMRQLLQQEGLPVAAVITLTKPLFRDANLRFVQTLRAKHLRSAELERLLAAGHGFDPRHGFFSLHNELQTLLELSGSLEAMMQQPGAEQPGAGTGAAAAASVGVVVGTPLSMDVKTLAQLLDKHVRGVTAPQGDAAAQSAAYRRMAALSYTIALKRVILDTVRGSYEAIAAMFDSMTRQWVEDQPGLLEGASAWRMALIGRGESTEECDRWTGELEKWGTDMGTWRSEMDKWRVDADGWKKEVSQVEQAVSELVK